MPQVFWTLLPKTGRYAYAAIIHDYLYWTQKVERDEADNILYYAMVESGVSWLVYNSIYGAVKKWGDSAWEQNAKDRKAGKKRLLKNFPPKTKLISWAEWSKDPANFAD